MRFILIKRTQQEKHLQMICKLQSKPDFVIGCIQEHKRVVTIMENERNNSKVIINKVALKEHTHAEKGDF